MVNTEQKIKEYYIEISKKDRLEYELKILVSNNEKLISCREGLNGINKNEILEKRIAENRNKIIDKQLKINDILEKHAGMEYILSDLDSESRKLLKLRYRYGKAFEAMKHELNMSKSSISRKNSKLVDFIASNLSTQA